MKLTRERKIFGAVLVLALGGLGFDQLTASSDASQTDDAGTGAAVLLADTSGSSPSSNAAHNSSKHGDDVSFAERLATLASDSIKGDAVDDSRDLFRPSSDWLGQSGGEGYRNVDAAKFAQVHKLSTVSTNGQGAVAVVDGKLMHVGSTLDGFRLMWVDRQSACFRASDGSEVKLKLTTSPGATSLGQAR